MAWFSAPSARATAEQAHPSPGGREAVHHKEKLQAHPQRRRLRSVHRSQVLEPRSLTDARARVGAQDTVPARKSHVRSTFIGLPLALLASDVAAILLESVVIRPGLVSAAIFGVMLLVSRALVRQYRPRMYMSVLDDVPRALGSTLAAVGLTLVVMSVVSGGPLPERELLLRSACFLAFALVLQALTFAVARRERRSGRVGRRTLIVGAGHVGSTVSEALLEHPELGLSPVGYADPEVTSDHGHSALPVLTTDMSRLPRTIVEHEIDTTILAFNGVGDAHVDTVITVHQTGCSILLVPSMFELHHDGPDVERVRGVPLLRLRPDPTLRPSWWVKRAIDVSLGGIFLLLASIPMAVVAGLILLDSGRPVFFWQDRVGLDGNTFRLCKFRSLRPSSEHESQTTWNIADDPRVSKVGRFLRRTSIDEIPQLWNIVRGQMSLVGPRPERPAFVQKFSQEHERYWARHRVPVGLTGLAQVNGLRGDTSIRERARYDNYYIANWSLWLDLKIVLMTAREVVGGSGR